MRCNAVFLGGLLIAAVSSATVENDGIKIIERIEWGAHPPAHPPTPLTKIPPPYVIISHTASLLCSTQAECSKHIQDIQTMHIEGNGWDDIGYNFLVGGDGNVYAGRGWDVQGAHTLNYNSKSIGISFIGSFNDVAPNEKQLLAAQQLLKVGEMTGKLANNYKLFGHRQLSNTLSPGDQLYKIIKTWPHWSEKP